MVVKTNEIVSAGLVAAMAIGSKKLLDKYSKNKNVNSAVAISGSFLALEYLRANKMVPVVGDIDINRKGVKKD